MVISGKDEGRNAVCGERWVCVRQLHMDRSKTVMVADQV